LSFTAEGRDARESSLDARTPWTLFRTAESWRANPAVTDGKYRSAVASFRLDTRNDRGAPSAGWFVTGEYEIGHGEDVTGNLGPFLCVTIPCVDPELADGKLGYQRIGFDVRRYLRLSPSGRLDLRLAGGGWVGGDPLPLQRRLSLGYPDPLPGYGFRQFSCGGGQLYGEAALCDRAVVAQAEFRTHLGFDFGPKWASDWGDNGDEHYEPFHVSGPDLVFFADAGRAWSVSRGGSAGADIIPADRLPALSTFRTDIGLGLDFGPLGFYLAKALDKNADRMVTFTVRMGRRF
jgi:outer membrane protein assembly factor BamA